MKVIVGLLVCVFVAVVLAADPTPPKWPQELKADIEVEMEKDHSRFQAQWVFSTKFNAERTTSYHTVNQLRTIDIRLYKTNEEYIIVESPKNVTTCHKLDITGHMEVPSFVNFKYSGKTVIHGQNLDTWKDGADSYFDDSHQLPVRFENKTAESMIDFYNVDINGVMPSFFSIPAECNKTGASAGDCVGCQQLALKAYQSLGCNANAGQIQAFCGSLAGVCETTIHRACAKQCLPAACAHQTCCTSGTCSCTTGTAAGHAAAGHAAAGHSGSGSGSGSGNGSDNSSSSDSNSGGSSGGGSSGGSSSGGGSGGGSSGAGVKVQSHKAKIAHKPL